jgi:hypothetical protein
MNLKKFQPILEVLILAVVFYAAHKLVFLLNDDNPKLQGFNFFLETIYEFFFSCSVIIIFILIVVKERSIDNVGNTFLLVTCLKIAVSFVILSPILQSKNPNVSTEKLNFFLIFALFLFIETIVTARILNKTQ